MISALTYVIPIQIVVVRKRSDPRTDAYIDTIRLAFEGSAGRTGSPSAYLAEAVDLGIRVLEPADDLEETDIEQLVGGARNTIVVAVGASTGLIERLESRLGTEHIVRVPPPPLVTDGEIQGDKSQDGVEPIFAPVVAALRAMHQARRVLLGRIERNGRDDDGLKLFISHARLTEWLWPRR